MASCVKTPADFCFVFVFFLSATHCLVGLFEAHSVTKLTKNLRCAGCSPDTELSSAVPRARARARQEKKAKCGNKRSCRKCLGNLLKLNPAKKKKNTLLPETTTSFALNLCRFSLRSLWGSLCITARQAKPFTPTGLPRLTHIIAASVAVAICIARHCCHDDNNNNNNKMKWL